MQAYLVFDEGQVFLISPDSRWFRSNRPVKELWEKYPDERSRILVLQDQKWIEKWGAKEADLVEFQSGPPKIMSVSDIPAASMCKARPSFVEDIVEGVNLDHPDTEIPINILDSTTMYLVEALAVIGLGAEILVTGPSKSGKTWTARDLMKAIFEAIVSEAVPGLTPENVRVMILNAGERVGDVRQTTQQVITPYRGVLHIEHFVGFTSAVAVKNIRFSKKRMHRLVESGVALGNRHTIVCIDSIWGAMQALTQATQNSSGGLAGKGISRDALVEGKEFLFAGRIPKESGGGSLTQVVTCLHEGAGSGSEVVYKEIGGNLASVEIRHRVENDRSIPRPWLDFNFTDAREAVLFGPERHQLYLDFQSRALRAGEGNPGRALGYLRELFDRFGWDIPAIRERWAKEGAAAPRRREREARREEPAEPVPSVAEIVDFGGQLVERGLLNLPISETQAHWLHGAGVTLKRLKEHLEAGGKLSGLYS